MGNRIKDLSAWGASSSPRVAQVSSELFWGSRKEKIMGIINVIRTVKELHKKDIVMVRGGKFIYVYGKDAVIVSYMYNYQI